MELTLAIDNNNKNGINKLLGGVENKTTASVFPACTRVVCIEADPMIVLISQNGLEWTPVQEIPDQLDMIRSKIKRHQAIQTKYSRLSIGDILLLTNGSEIRFSCRHACRRWLCI
jgi:hypothetical protein